MIEFSSLLKNSPLLIAWAIFFFLFILTFILAIKRKISFLTTFCILLFSIPALTIMHYVQETPHDSQALFDAQIAQAVQDIQKEVLEEKENLKKLVGQVDEILDQLDEQKQKLQQFISEKQDNFKNTDIVEE